MALACCVDTRLILPTREVSYYCTFQSPIIACNLDMLLKILTLHSPVWLTRQGRQAEAEAALRRLAVEGLDVFPDLERMVKVDRQEQLYEAKSTYSQIFKGINLRRTMISTVSYASIATTGTQLASSAAYFMLRKSCHSSPRLTGPVVFAYEFHTYNLHERTVAGVAAGNGFYWSLGCTLAAFFAAFVGLWILSKRERRRVYVWAQAISAIALLAIGFLQLDPSYYQSHRSVYAQGACMVLWNLVYGAVIGPLSTVIMGEVPSNALRAKTVAFATMVQVCTVVLGMVLQPYFLDPAFGHLQGYVGFISGGSGVLWTVWAFFYLPETSLGIEELDTLFERRVNARHFARNRVIAG